MFARTAAASVLVASLLSLVGCAAPSGANGSAEVSESGITSERESGIEVNASTKDVLIDTPTYGYNPTAPFLTIEVLVDDAKLRKTHPGFDGYEHAFALVPRKVDGETRFARMDLLFTGQRVEGYMQLRNIDIHELRGVRISTDVLEAIQAEGIAVGLDTNEGTIWAQEPGKNFRPVHE